MNIYIYGTKSFQKDMTKILNENNLKQKVAKYCTVIKLNTVSKLKEAILLDPTDIYLIDHNAIIVKNFFTTKLKILNVKEGIEEEFLKEHGIGDMSIDNVADISQHIIKRLESLNLNDDDNTDECTEVLEEDIINDEIMDEDMDKQDTILNELEAMDEEIVEEVLEKKQKETEIKDNSMENSMEELTQLDDIDEANLLEALSDIDGIEIIQKEKNKNTIEIDSSQMDSVAALLEQLMNNKTLEISIKVKN